MKTVLTSLWPATMLLHSACGDCTLRPCPGLAVQLQGAVPTEYTVTVSSPSESSMSRTCSPTTPCSGNASSSPGMPPTWSRWQ
jgi:hypothetical protein